MMTAERTILQEIDQGVTLTTDPAPGYLEAAMGACLSPQLPQGDFLPALDVLE